MGNYVRKTSPIAVWLMAGLLLSTVAAGAVGAIVSGSITGNVLLTASQSLTILDLPASTTDRFIGTMSDDRTAFTAAADVSSGDFYAIELPLLNSGKSETVGKLCLFVPDGVIVDAEAGYGVTELARTTPTIFIFKVEPGESVLYIIIAIANEVGPGFRTIRAVVEQVAR